MATEVAFLGRYARQPASEILAMPRTFRRLLAEEVKKLLSMESGMED